MDTLTRTDIAFADPSEGPPGRPSLGLVGVGAFGAFALPYLGRFFDLHLSDPSRALGDLAIAARADVVVLAVPLAALASVAREIAPHLRPGALVVDVCSIKAKPLALLAAALPGTVDIVGTHPLFGPESGRAGIAGLRIAVCEGRGGRAPAVARFLRRCLGLTVIRTTAEAHDRQMAYVQGLTHLIARAVLAMEMPPIDLATTTFAHLMRMVDTVRHDSPALVRTITRENPHAEAVRRDFLAALEAVSDAGDQSGSRMSG